MKQVLMTLVLLTVAGVSAAQTMPPTIAVRTVANPAQVYRQAQAEIEVFPTQRGTLIKPAVGRSQVHALRDTPADSPFSPTERGVLYNYAQQQYGFTDGEIVFMVKDAGRVPILQLGGGLEPKKISGSGIYSVYARTPALFLDTVRRLQQFKDIRWVEPRIQYGAVHLKPALK